MGVKKHPNRRRTARVRAAMVAVTSGLMAAGSAAAFPINTDNNDLRVTLDTTVKYSGGVRTGQRKDNVANSSIGVQANTNDGDMNFNRGSLITNRFDILSELGVTYKNDFGIRVSGAGWYDDVYNHSNDNPGDLGGALVNSRSVRYNQFTDKTRELHGGNAELLDAFAFAKLPVGDKNINLKAGRFTQLYGESLFFGSNGVAAAQTSLDLIKALSVPNSRFQEILRPVGQVSASMQLSSDLSIGAYYQLEWRKSRLPGAGSYFSFADFVDGGGESLILGPGAVAFRGDDLHARDSGQGGFQVKYSLGDVDYGFYAAQFHDKMPQFYVRPGVNARSGSVGDYVQVYGENIRMVGTSASTVIGGVNVAAEVSFRDNMPLVARGNAVVLPGNSTADGDKNAAYPVGKTGHINLSAINVFAGNGLWDGASIIGEVAYNTRLSVDKNREMLDPLATRDAAAIQFVFTPEYFQVLPGLDVQVPIGFGYGLFGRSSVNGALFPSEKGGNISIGLKAEYQKTWLISLNYSHFFGSSGSVVRYDTAAPELSYDNFHGDRDFVTLSIQRSF